MTWMLFLVGHFILAPGGRAAAGNMCDSWRWHSGGTFDVMTSRALVCVFLSVCVCGLKSFFSWQFCKFQYRAFCLLIS